LYADGGERPHAHQHFAVACDHQYAPLRLRERQAQPEHRGVPHRTPQREIERRIAGRGDVPGSRPQTGYHQEVFSIL
jgi:hypothetical protein